MILLIKETEETTQDREKETNPWLSKGEMRWHQKEVLRLDSGSKLTICHQPWTAFS